MEEREGLKTGKNVRTCFMDDPIRNREFLDADACQLSHI